MSKAKEIILSKPRRVKVDYNIDYTFDLRRKCDRYIYEYLGSDEEEYRKAFYVQRGQEPNIPASGTHKEINALQKQL